METANPSTLAEQVQVDANEFDGLLWGYRFFESGIPEIIQGPAVREALEKEDNWIWIHFDLNNEWARSAIKSLPNLPSAAVAKLLSTDERQHVDNFGQVIGGVVADYERNDPLDIRRIIRWQFAMSPNLFVSAGRCAGHTLQQVQLDLQSGRCYLDVLRLFDAIVHEFTTATSFLLDDLTAKLDELEERLLDDKDISGHETLGGVRRSLVRLRRQAVPLRAVLVHMLTDRPAWFNDQAVTNCQRVAARMDSLADDLESLQERAISLQDELNVREAEKINKRLTVLSIVSALLLPPTLITGIFGMNVAGLPWRDTPVGFLAACGLMGVSAAVMLFVLRRIKLL